MLGKVTERIPAQNRLVATANPIPSSEMSKLRASLEDDEILTTMAEREHFSRISERDRPFSCRIKGAEEVDEQTDRDGTSCRFCVCAYESAEPGGEQSPRHLRKGEEK